MAAVDSIFPMYSSTGTSVEASSAPSLFDDQTSDYSVGPAAPIISDLFVGSGKAYQVVEHGLDTGAPVYVDRSFVFSSLPNSVAGVSYIMTANDDKGARQENFISFKVDQPVTVLVSYDSRASSPPDWLSSWTSTGLTVGTTDVNHNLFSKEFSGGTITLGGNLATGASGALSNYFIVVQGRDLLIPIPGRVEVEDYKDGREGVGYHDSSRGNQGGAYRNDDVDIAAAGTGFAVGWITPGEWLAFDVDVAQAGNHDITARVASQVTGAKTLHLEIDGENITGPMSFTDSSGWAAWRDLTVKNVALPEGHRALRLVFDTGGFNIDYLDVVPSAPINQAPIVNAGPDQSVNLSSPVTVSLSGTVTDDGMSNPPGKVTLQWSQVSGPRSAVIANPATAATTGTFTEVGTYVLELSADDGDLSASSQVTITVNSPALELFNLSVASGKSYEVVDEDLVSGSQVFIDRNYTFRSIPMGLTGSTYIKTANDDKSRKDNALVTFQANQDVTVYVAYDERASSLPNWLMDWNRTGDSISTTDVSFELFAKRFSTNSTVTLGGNLGAGASGANSNYYIMVSGQQEAPVVSSDDQPPSNDQALDRLGIKMIYPSSSEGIEWDSGHWNNGHQRDLKQSAHDTYDPTGWSRHAGSQNITIDGKGLMIFNKKFGGTSPRFYIDVLKNNKEFKNVEVTAYRMRIEDADLFYGGFVFGVRSGPHTDCTAHTYYGRIGNDGNSVFVKELDHPHSSARSSQPIWRGAPMPKNKWIGMKFAAYNLPNGHVKLELYLDETNGANGGDWKLINEYTDTGGWAPENHCPDRPSDYIITDGGVVFIRDTDVNDGRYSRLTAREITLP